MTVAQALQQQLHRQLDAFAQGAPDYHRRMQALATLRDGLHAHQEELLHAVSADFGGRAHEETLLLELFPLYDQIRHARRHLKGWMRRKRVSSSWFLWPSRAYVQYQPLGVVGVVGAWNYQLLLTLGPLVDAIAAGNHVMVKPSEITPRSAQVIASIIHHCFAPEYVSCVTGGAEVAASFSALPFDHLFFTGSTRVGRIVMQAAAANLTPVTLELGGKSPAIIHRDYPLTVAVQRIVAAKLCNAGQTCVAPDYVLLPAGSEGAFEEEARRVATRFYPTLADNEDYTRVVNSHHSGRLTMLVEDAAAKGARIVRLGPLHAEGAPDHTAMPLTLIFGAIDAMHVMREEIFGPVLPVLTYRDLAEAVAFVNARPRPLALYYFDNNSARIDSVLASTLSGGVTVNDCMYHLGQHNLPFGGVGPSGMGHYHGFDGFATFSKKRGIMMQSRWTATALFHPPYGKRSRFAIDLLLKLARR